MERRREIEEAVYNIARNFGIESSKGSLLATIRILRNKELIDPVTSALLDDLRSIGNAAAHADVDAVFTKGDALRFGALADRVIARLVLLSSPRD